MTKKLTPTELFNRNLSRHLDAIVHAGCGAVICGECILNNAGEKSRKNTNTFGHTCGLAAISNTICAYRSNFKKY